MLTPQEELAATKRVAQLWFRKAMERKKELAQLQEQLNKETCYSDRLFDKAKTLEFERDTCNAKLEIAEQSSRRLAILDAAEAALANCGLTGIYDGFDGPADAIKEMVERLVQLEGGPALQAERRLRREAEEQVTATLHHYRTQANEYLAELCIEQRLRQETEKYRDMWPGTMEYERARAQKAEQRAEHAEALAQLVTPELVELLGRLAMDAENVHRHAFGEWAVDDNPCELDARAARALTVKIREALDEY